MHEATVNTTNQNQIDCKQIMHIVDDAGGITTNQIQGDWMQIYIVQDTAEKQATKGQQEVIQHVVQHCSNDGQRQGRCPSLKRCWIPLSTYNVGSHYFALLRGMASHRLSELVCVDGVTGNSATFHINYSRLLIKPERNWTSRSCLQVSNILGNWNHADTLV